MHFHFVTRNNARCHKISLWKPSGKNLCSLNLFGSIEVAGRLADCISDSRINPFILPFSIKVLCEQTRELTHDFLDYV